MEYNKVYLNMDYDIDPEDGSVYEARTEKERYIPKDHRYFLEFLDADIEGPMTLLERAIKEGKKEHTGKAYDLVRSLHPFFESRSRAAACINETLALLVSRADLPGEEKEKIFKETGVFFDGMEDSFSYWEPNSCGKGSLQNLLRIQEDLRHMAAILLDAESPFAAYPTQVRNGIYGIMSAKGDMLPSIDIVPGKVVLPVPGAVSGLRAALDFHEEFSYEFYKAVKEAEGGGEGLPSMLESIMKTLSEKEEEDTDAWAEYDTPYLEDVLSLEVADIIDGKETIKRCRSCGRRFLSPNETDKYCSLPGKDNISCLERKCLEETKEAVDGIYTQAYRTRYARMASGKETKESLDKWREKAKELKAVAMKGAMSPEAYKKTIMEL